MTRKAGVAAHRGESSRAARYRALGLATLAFAANFWAWGLIAPLAPRYQAALDLSPVQVSVLVALPVLLGSLLRPPLGALTDRYGGRVMLTACCMATLGPLALLAVADGYVELLAAGLLLGVSGASFAVGVPFVNAWFPPTQRGFALGVYGLGNIGTGVASFTASGMADALGRTGLFVTMAAVMAAVAVVITTGARDAPGRHRSTLSVAARLRTAARLPAVIDLAGVYAVTFGGFVAFAVYLPTYLTDLHDVAPVDAAVRTGGFVALATVARPAGGWLSDRHGGATVIRAVLAVVGLGALTVAVQPGLAATTVVLFAVATAFGAGNGGVFALVSEQTPAEHLGSVSGLVGAAGGLGGFLPPIVMGMVRQATGDYAVGLMLLSTVAFASLVHVWWRFLVVGGGSRSPTSPGTLRQR